MLWFFPISLLLIESCDLLITQEAFPSDIEVISLKLPNSGYKQLMGSTYLNDWVGAEVKAGGWRYEGRLRISGNVTRHDVKKSYRLELIRGGFDPGLHQYEYVLSSQSRDESFIRYRLASHFFRKAGFYCSNLRPVELFIDNELHGLYLEREVIDSAFFLDRGLSISSLYKIHTNALLNAGDLIVPQQILEKKLPDGDRCYDDIEKLVEIATAGIDESTLPTLRKILNLENALDYYAVSILVNNGDGVKNNYYLYLNPDTELFEFIPWDLDQTFNLLYADIPVYENGLFEQLDRIPYCHDYVLRRIAELYDHEEALQLAERYRSEVEIAYRRDPFLIREGKEIDAAAAGVFLYLDNLFQIVQKLEI